MLKTGKRIGIFLIMICILCFITGCGKKPSVSDVIGEMEEDGTGEGRGQDTDTSGESAAAFQKGELSDSLGMKDSKWEESFAVDSENINLAEINVDIQLPDTDHMNVVDLELNTDSSGAVKALIAKLFDDGKAGVLAEGQYPKWKLEELVKQYELTVTNWEGQDVTDESYAEAMKEDKDRLEEYRGQLLKANDDMTAPTDYEESGYWGRVNGKIWELTKYKSGKNEYGFDARLVNKQEGLVSQLDGDADTIYTEAAEGDAKNACTLSQEDAVRQAEEWLSKMGYGELEVKETESLKWTMAWLDKPEETFVEGYRVYFGRAIDGVQVSIGNYAMPVSDGWIVDDYTDEAAWVNITDAGVVSFGVQCPRTSKTDSVTETSLLSIDMIQSRIKECIQQKAGETVNTTIKGNSLHELRLDHMDLVYFVLPGDGYTVIPVWRIYNCSNGDIDSYLLFNAIDGSEIDVMSAYCRILTDEQWEEEFGEEE